MSDTIRRQYEDLPYPSRNPADEKQRLIIGSPSHWLEIRHHAWGGRTPSSPRILFAGGGTGDGLIMLAQQCADIGIKAEIIYLDLSTASRGVAEARAHARGLRGIRFITGSLLDIAELAPGPYDYIDCCGVLHHLPDPAAGLDALTEQLSPQGGMGIMLYGALGRTGVYPLQSALASLTDNMNGAEKIAITKNLLSNLPDSNWFRKNPWLNDHADSDAGLYDLLLHSQDRAYSVKEIHALAAGAGLMVGAFIEPLAYDPTIYLKDATLRERACALSLVERQTLAENLAGSFKTHVFYVRPQARADDVLNAGDKNATPQWRDISGAAVARTLTKGRIAATIMGLRHEWQTPLVWAQIAGLIDGRSIAEIEQKLNLEKESFQDEWPRFYDFFHGLNLLLLRR